MADNSSVPVASGNETFANKDIGGVKFPKHIPYDSSGAEIVPATQTTAAAILAAVDALETLIASTNTKLDTAITALQIIDNMVLAAGTANIGDVDVLTLPALPAGTNAIGKLAANSGVDIGDVDVTTIAGVAPSFGDGAKGSTVLRTTLATDSAGIIATAAPGTLTAAGPSVTAVNPSHYETVAASQTAQALGAAGATGDFINGILVVPATTSPGNVLLLDNATSITVFTGGATSVSNLVPFFIPLGMTSVSGAWKITTGSNVSAVGIGKFT